MKVLYKVFLGLGIAGVIMGIALIAMGNMLGVWILGFGAYGVYKDYRLLRRKASVKDKE